MKYKLIMDGGYATECDYCGTAAPLAGFKNDEKWPEEPDAKKYLCRYCANSTPRYQDHELAETKRMMAGMFNELEKALKDSK